MIPNIALIDDNEDFDDYDYSELCDYRDYDEEEFNREHVTDCRSCGGTGEGTASGYSCNWCNGRGYIIKKH